MGRPRLDPNGEKRVPRTKGMTDYEWEAVQAFLMQIRATPVKLGAQEPAKSGPSVEAVATCPVDTEKERPDQYAGHKPDKQPTIALVTLKPKPLVTMFKPEQQKQYDAKGKGKAEGQE